MSSNAGAAGSVPAVRRSEAEWAAIMAEYDRSGPAQKDFCGRKGHSCKTFRAWRRRPGLGGGTGGFVRIEPPESAGALQIELSLGDGVVLRTGHSRCWAGGIRAASFCRPSLPTL